MNQIVLICMGVINKCNFAKKTSADSLKKFESPRKLPAIGFGMKLNCVPFRYLTSLLRASETKFVRIVWCDSANVIRAKAASVPRLESVHKDGIGLVTGTQVGRV